MFQSSPARGGGCNTRTLSLSRPRRAVSILTRPWGRVQRQTMSMTTYAIRVSILTRPWGQVQQVIARACGVLIQFQSSPARGGRCNSASAPTVSACASCFNPHPPVGAGATYGAEVFPHGMYWFQSSPARGGRVQPFHATQLPPDSRSFQSSPARGGGCNVASACYATSRASFQSSPARGGGCNLTIREFARELGVSSFQSSPARGSGCNATYCSMRSRTAHGFNPHPPVGAGATPAASRSHHGGFRFQSSPARGGGCNAAWRTRGSGSPNASVPVVKVCRAALWAANGWAFAYGHKVCSVTPLGGLPTCTE